MKKQIFLTKKLIKDIIVLSVVLVLLGGGVFYVYDYVQGQEKRQADVESSIQQMDSKIGSIRTNYDKANVSIEIYKDISDKLESGVLQADDKTLREILLALKERFRLSQLNLKLEPEKEYKENPTIANNSVVDLKYRKVELKLGGISDIHLLCFCLCFERRAAWSDGSGLFFYYPRKKYFQ